ncbi:dTDP-4-dehydrorhamnose 3,5-epimerase [Ponticaulis profundi]|uniref:dTDP-4-dehydrorhamnose 3,5-epimerase n=1 Tax=Ponticaulis profundi TaxID=2665222 RepID=A0ABW1SAH6_9PROT
MQITRFDIPGLFLLKPKIFRDDRGWFSETFNAETFREALGFVPDFVQDNESFSMYENTIRGLHLQLNPYAQAKLVRVLSGAILDVVVDIRKGSPTYLSTVSVRLDATGMQQFYIPAGFLHGFRTLEDNTRIAYKVDAHYNAQSDRTIRFDDPALKCNWDLDGKEKLHLSDKDKDAPPFKSLGDVFQYDDMAGPVT